MNRPDQISVAGAVHLGERLHLQQRAPTPDVAVSFAQPGMGSINPADIWPVSPAPGRFDAVRMTYTFEPTGRQMRISGEGLKTGYLVLGSPGSGKTVLILHLLRQLLALNADDPGRKYGALILDPKATLADRIRRMLADAGRPDDDLIVINPAELERTGRQFNPIDVSISAGELGKRLVLAARSARAVEVSDQFWSLSWGNVFGAALNLLQWREGRVVTLRRLLDALSPVPGSAMVDGRAVREIEHIAKAAAAEAVTLPAGSYRDLLKAVDDIRRFYAADYVGTVEEIFNAAYGQFRESRLDMFSPDETGPGEPREMNFYDDIIENGKVVLVSVPNDQPQLARTLCTLIKCLFQTTVLGRKERVLRGSGRLTNFTRPLLLACDEFGEVATELPAEPVGDGQFFDEAREAGCMGILGVQGISALESAVKESWPRIASAVVSTIVMRSGDHKTLDLVQKLAGRSDWAVSVTNLSLGPQGPSLTTSTSLQTRENLPVEIVTQYLPTGHAWCLGSLDARQQQEAYFIRVPYDNS
jgi:hypothetical protein